MSKRTPSEEFLNAYVDGELSPHDQAWVAHAIATDPAIADQVAALARLKSVVSGLGDERSVRLEDLGAGRSARPRAVSMIAASVAALLLVTGVAAGAYWSWRDTKTAALVAEAKSRHLAWLAEASVADGSGDVARMIRATMHRRNVDALIPDMRSAKLTLTDVAYFKGVDGAGSNEMQLRYTGRRGCRVSLWLLPGASPITTSLTELNDGHSRGFYWRVDNISYALFATGMDTDRFSLLARNVYEATRDRRKPSVQRQRELRVATDTAPPCRT